MIVSSGGAGGTAPPAGAALAAHALTETAAPESATSTAIGRGKNNSNRERPTEGPTATPRPTADPDSDVPSAASSGESDGNSDYINSCKNLPASSVNTPEIAGHISEIEQLHEVAVVEIGEFYQLRELFTHPDEVDPTELANDETTPAKNH